MTERKFANKKNKLKDKVYIAVVLLASAYFAVGVLVSLLK